MKRGRIRLCTMADWETIHRIRMAVGENILSDPNAVTRGDYEDMLTRRGRGWVYEDERVIRGFAIADNLERNIWALFVEPGHEGRGIGRALMTTMMQWLFEQGRGNVRLTTGPGTRAEKLYRRAGWREAGVARNGDLVLELSWEDYAMDEPPVMLDGARVLEYAAVEPGGKSHVSVVVGGVSLDTATVTRLVIAENLVDGGVFLMHCNDDWNTVAAGQHREAAAARRSAEAAYRGISLSWRPFRALTPEEAKEVETTRAFLREIASGEGS